jgi:hypothetical protein
MVVNPFEHKKNRNFRSKTGSNENTKKCRQTSWLSKTPPFSCACYPINLVRSCGSLEKDKNNGRGIN